MNKLLITSMTTVLLMIPGVAFSEGGCFKIVEGQTSVWSSKRETADIVTQNNIGTGNCGIEILTRVRHTWFIGEFKSVVLTEDFDGARLQAIFLISTVNTPQGGRVQRIYNTLISCAGIERAQSAMTLETPNGDISNHLLCEEVR